MHKYIDRADAGRRLSKALRDASLSAGSTIVLALPRGGVPVGYEIATELNLPMDVLVVRKIGAPSYPEFGIGAICEGGFTVIDRTAAARIGATEEDIQKVIHMETDELERRKRVYRSHAPYLTVHGMDVVLVDDGLATGGTAEAACRALRAWGAHRVILAVPVASKHAVERLMSTGGVDKLVCPLQPTALGAVGHWYQTFGQTQDEEVLQLLADARRLMPPFLMGGVAAGHKGPFQMEPAGEPAREMELDTRLEGRIAPPGVPHPGQVVKQDVELEVPAGPGVVDQTVILQGHLWLPAGAMGIVVFAHGSGNGRNSAQNQQVASHLNNKGGKPLVKTPSQYSVPNSAGMGTLLFDLLTTEEAEENANVFNVPLLAHRLERSAGWLRSQGLLPELPLGIYGTSTGAAAALWAAADMKDQVAAVVSRGGRPDLAIPRLREVTTPTLLIVGGHDPVVLGMNERARNHLTSCLSQLSIVPGIGHLFEEPGASEQVQQLASHWFATHLGASSCAHASAGTSWRKAP